MANGSLPGRAARALSGYLKRHPQEVLRAAKNAATMKVGVPVQALSWLARELGGDRVPADLKLQERAPGLYASASFEMMKTPLRGAANIIVESVKMMPTEILIDVRIEDISLEVTRENVGTPVAALLQSGALDLSRPGDLISYMPKRPSILVGAKGNVLTLDLMRHPKLSADRARRIVGLLVPLVGVDNIRTEDAHLNVAFQPFPGGAGEILDRVKDLF